MRTLIGIVVGVAISSVALFLFTHFGGRLPGTPAACLSTPAAIPFWPGDQAWSWTFAVPRAGKDGDWIALRIREKSVPASPTSVPGIGMVNSAMTRAEADREFGTGNTGF